MFTETLIAIAIVFLLLGIRKHCTLYHRLGFSRCFCLMALSPCLMFGSRLVTFTFSYGWLPKIWLGELNMINSVLHVLGAACFYFGARDLVNILDPTRLFMRPRLVVKKEKEK